MGRRVWFSAGSGIFLAFMILLVPLKWVVSMVLAAAVHELCHYFALQLCSKPVTAVQILPYGARMPLPEIGRGGELFCALSGPFGSLLLVLLAPVFPRLALCAAAQGIFNLLPIYPLDGGRACHCLFSMLFTPPMAARIGLVIEILACGAIFALGCYGTIRLRLGLLPLIFAIWILMRCFLVKIPCKPARLGVQ